MNKILSTLNEQQKEVAELIDWPLLVVAGAGTWKTRALTYRIANMINEKIMPWNILAITFTNKAANEIKERVIKILETENISTQSPAIGTFHSVCLRILRSEITILWYENNFIVYDTLDQKSVMKQVLSKLNIDPKQYSPKSFLNKISFLKNNLTYSNVDLGYILPEENNIEQISQVYKEYQKALKQSNAVDFDDLIALVCRIFEKNSEILTKYQNKFQYILVDEYQDTNHSQYRFIKLLSAKHKNLCVIGDSDQSIYAFRGADISNILNFKKEFKTAITIRLEKNYRSTKTILNASNHMIKNNSSHQEKEMFTDNDEGEKITILEKTNETEEARVVINKINTLINNGVSAKDIVIMYRTNAQSRLFEEFLLHYSLQYKIIWGLKFYSRKEIKDIIAYLRILQNPEDNVSLNRIINVPARKIWKTSINKVLNIANQKELSMFNIIKHIDVVDWLTSWSKQSFIKFLDLYEELQLIQKKQPLSDFIDTVIDKTGYWKLLSDKTQENLTRRENLEELKSVATRYDKYDERALELFLEEVALIQDADNIDETQEQVTLMTIHASKWLEFENVFLTGMEETIFPHVRSLNNNLELEEERRLMYVAITRAKNKLYLSYAKQRMIFGKKSFNPVSRFIKEIPVQYIEKDKPKQSTYSFNTNYKSVTPNSENIQINQDPKYSYDEDSQCMDTPNYKEWMKVYHQVFWQGTIISANEEFITISFWPGNTKKFMASMAPIRIMN